MLDDRETTEGDLVHDGNIAQWKQQFVENSGHSMECIDETMTDMANLIGKVCLACDLPSASAVTDNMSVELFDKHIRAILNSKDCNCNK